MNTHTNQPSLHPARASSLAAGPAAWSDPPSPSYPSEARSAWIGDPPEWYVAFVGALQHLNRARYYSPNIGRMISEDPVRYFAGPSLYSYAHGNSVAARDPFGLLPYPFPGPGTPTDGVTRFPGNPNPVPKGGQNPFCKGPYGYPPEWWNNTPDPLFMDPIRMAKAAGRAAGAATLFLFDAYLVYCIFNPGSPDCTSWTQHFTYTNYAPHPPDALPPSPSLDPCPKDCP